MAKTPVKRIHAGRTRSPESPLNSTLAPNRKPDDRLHTPVTRLLAPTKSRSKSEAHAGPQVKHFLQLGLIGLLGALVLPSITTRLIASETPPPNAPAAAPKSGTAAAREVLRQAFVYDPAVRKEAEAEAAAKESESAVRMEAFVVTDDPHRNPSFNAYVARQRRREETKKPSVSDGAAIHGRIDVGVMTYKDPIPFGTPIPRWSLIKMPW